MCGIAGIFHFARTSPPDRVVVAKMTAALAHRGPDDSGLFVDPQLRVALGHRRLSIIDLSASGRQPMTRGDFTIVYNGEVYNHRELRDQFQISGVRFSTHTDTEAILCGWQQDKEKSLSRLRGMFALAIWDRSERSLTLVRDRIGIKPLYYAFKNGAVIFASEIKAILQHPEFSAEINPEALYHYLTLAAAPAPMTMFKGIQKLPAGHWLRVDARGKITITRWWDAIAQPAEPSVTEEDAIAGIRDRLRDAVRSHMVSDVPFGVFLSGGVDSTTNVALMAELMDRPVQTFSVGIRGDDRFNEFAQARRIAQHFGCDHQEVEIDDEDFLRCFEHLAHDQDEPLADPVCVPLYYVARLARQAGVPVIQVGEGADELFCGYPKFLWAIRLAATWKSFSRMPSAMWRAPESVFGGLLRRAGRDLEREHLRRLGRREELFWGGAMAFMEYEKRMLLAPEVVAQLSKINTGDIVGSLYDGLDQGHNSSNSYFARMRYLEFKQRLPELLLMRVDKMAMAHAIETRVPYLDHQLVEYVLSLPAEWHYKNGTLKYLLKKAVSGIIPDEVLNRPKVGFCGSARNMVSERVAAYAEKLLLDNQAPTAELLNRNYVARVFRFHRQGRNQGMRIWNLLNLALWVRRWIGVDRPVEV